LTDWLAQDHLAWFVLDAVEQIDLTQFYKKYRTDGVGNSAFHPSMMAALLLLFSVFSVSSVAHNLIID